MASDPVQRQVDRLLDSAEGAITNEDSPTVDGRTRSVLAIDPVNSDAMAYLAGAEQPHCRLLEAWPESGGGCASGYTWGQQV